MVIVKKTIKKNKEIYMKKLYEKLEQSKLMSGLIVATVSTTLATIFAPKILEIPFLNIIKNLKMVLMYKFPIWLMIVILILSKILKSKINIIKPTIDSANSQIVGTQKSSKQLRGDNKINIDNYTEEYTEAEFDGILFKWDYKLITSGECEPFNIRPICKCCGKQLEVAIQPNYDEVTLTCFDCYYQIKDKENCEYGINYNAELVYGYDVYHAILDSLNYRIHLNLEMKKRNFEY